jgi:hypothetical protein
MTPSCVADRHGHDGGAVRRRRFDGARDDVGADEGPGRIVNQDDVGLGADRGEGVGHGILAPLAAGHQRHAGEPPGRRRQHVRRHRDDDVGNRRMRAEGVHRSLEQRAAAHVEQLLRHRRPQPPPAPSGRDNRRDLHRWWMGVKIQTSNYTAVLAALAL